MILFDNLRRVCEDISECGRGVSIIAACKTQTKETVDELASFAPSIIFGENRVQELLEKYDNSYKWHFIGQLQTNKVKYVIDKVDLIHSLDRVDLAKEIEKQAAKHGKVQGCLVEVNMGKETSKGGVAPEHVREFIASLKEYKHIDIQGIMSVLPKSDDEAFLHAMYERLQNIFEDVKTVVQENVHIGYLSAGMSGDYRIALEHGANMIRLGSLIFGQRSAAEN